jgi:hypothetical protein
LQLAGTAFAQVERRLAEQAEQRLRRHSRDSAGLCPGNGRPGYPDLR